MRKIGMLAILLGSFGLALSGCGGKDETSVEAMKKGATETTEAAKDAAKEAEDAAKTQPK